MPVQFLGWAPEPRRKVSAGEGLAALFQSLGQIAQQNLFNKDVQALQNAMGGQSAVGAGGGLGVVEGLDETNPVTPRSNAMNQMMGQNLMQSLIPMSPVDKVRLQAEKARTEYWSARNKSGVTPGYSEPSLDETGRMTGVKGALYQRGPTGKISILNTPEEPDTPEERLKYWQNVRRIANATDSGSVLNQMLAKSLGQDIEVTKDADLVKVADEKIKEIISEIRGKSSKTPPPKPISMKVPPPSRIAGEAKANKTVDDRIRAEVLSKVNDGSEVNRVLSEAANLKDIWPDLTDDEKVSAYRKLAEGWTASQLISALKNAQ